MADPLPTPAYKPIWPVVYLVRHAETEWSASGRHTGWSDIPLSARGEEDARGLVARLAGPTFSHVFVSPLSRARRTCELAGFGSSAQVDPDLREWNYGDYEGLTGAQIRARRPDWDIFRDGCPGGEGVEDVRARALRVLARLRGADGTCLVFSSAHMLRMLTACWLGGAPELGRYLYLGTTAISVLGYNLDLSDPVIRLWNLLALRNA